ncbi:hypothetical protein EVAR_20060_1 [Eumeta japonica]|uniref:Uncharacterized protein n=1 Tax=Eumeta variegata TaxID=151549 RepID=A0A4C1UJB4_EUMVA|nr:hypothetical protein EVAR_20060_1 [Eumeta japonica]
MGGGNLLVARILVCPLKLHKRKKESEIENGIGNRKNMGGCSSCCGESDSVNVVDQPQTAPGWGGPPPMDQPHVVDGPPPMGR